jgi:hypothetical protein
VFEGADESVAVCGADAVAAGRKETAYFEVVVEQLVACHVITWVEGDAGIVSSSSRVLG